MFTPNTSHKTLLLNAKFLVLVRTCHFGVRKILNFTIIKIKKFHGQHYVWSIIWILILFSNCYLQVSHVASVEGLPILDCSAEVSCINFVFTSYCKFFIENFFYCSPFSDSTSCFFLQNAKRHFL